MQELNLSDRLNDSYEYDYGDLIVHCQLEKYDQITGVCFIVISCFSFLGNILLLYSLARFEDLKRVTMLFLLCLAVFDLLFTLTLPFWAVENLKEWIFGSTACKILTGAYFVGIYGSLILLTAMTVDCFFFIVVRSKWLTRRRRLNCARTAFASSWIISIAACLKDALASEVKYVNSVRSCDSMPSSQDDQAGYYAQFVMLFAVPLVIIILCYGKILHTLMSSLGRRKYKTLLVVLLIILAFVACWGPYHVAVILMSYLADQGCEEKIRLNQAFISCRVLAYSHCCINPLLFLIRGRSRKILSSLLFCRPQHRNADPSDKSSDPSHFNIQQRFSVQVPQNVTELKSL